MAGRSGRAGVSRGEDGGKAAQGIDTACGESFLILPVSKHACTRPWVDLFGSVRVASRRMQLLLFNGVFRFRSVSGANRCKTMEMYVVVPRALSSTLCDLCSARERSLDDFGALSSDVVRTLDLEWIAGCRSLSIRQHVLFRWGTRRASPTSVWRHLRTGCRLSCHSCTGRRCCAISHHFPYAR